MLRLIEQLFLVTSIFYATFAVVALLTGIGGVSQSRLLFNGAQPYMELILAIYLAMFLGKTKKYLVLIPLLLASISAIATPNGLPFNYAIPMARPATINDHIISYTLMGLIDKDYYVSLYNSRGELGRIVSVQERGECYYNLGSTMSVVYYFIAPRVISAKSYWDPCIRAIGKVPEDTKGYIINKLFDAWIYGFYLYVKY